MEQIKILCYTVKRGFKVLHINKRQLCLLETLYIKGIIKNIKFFDMREISPIEELYNNYINAGNVDFSFYRLKSYFEEGLTKIEIDVDVEHKMIEYASIDRLSFLKDKYKFKILD